jgi:tetratricopeptide (TPR) repeat protein
MRAAALLCISTITLACAASENPEPTATRGAPPTAPHRSATAPPADAPPAFVGEEGTTLGDAPLRRPDRVAILALLRANRFTDLDRWFAHYHSRFEADPRNESWALDAFHAFKIGDPSLAAPLDAWVTASSNNFVPYAARGSWRLATGLAARGSAVASKTSEDQLRAMHEHFATARPDLERAISLNPAAIAPHIALMSIGMFTGDDPSTLRHRDAALAKCPSCYEPRALYLASLAPRWGGTYEAMDAYVAETAPLVAKYPRLAMLRGFAEWNRCRTATTDDPTKALPHCDRALAHGDEPRFLETRAWVHAHEKRPDAARADLDRILDLEPHHHDALVARHRIRRDAGDILGAAEDLVLAHTLDPTTEKDAKSVEWMVAKLRYDGDELRKAGNGDEASRHFALAVALAPNDKDLVERAAWGSAAIGTDELARRVAAAPDDYDLRLQLDHALMTKRKFPEIIASWDEYIANKPQDARAYRERAGAKWQARQHEAGVADMDKACELGNADACRDAPKMRARSPK